jgi:PAS domain S-box-containing protein
MSESSADTFRWQNFFQHAAQPIFLLNRRRRILFVNRAWESVTGLTLAEVRGRACRRRAASAAQEKEDAILSACAPPAEAIKGQTCSVRRRAPGSANWWAMQFSPLDGGMDLLGILGTIRVITAPADPPFTLPEKLMALRDRQARRYRLDELGTESAAMQRLHEQTLLAAHSQAPVAILGEPGVGKQWLARAIHSQSERRERYFVCLDAERLPPNLLGDVLFGPRSRQMGIGSVYLREPAQLPREWQGRLAETIRLRENPDFPRLLVGFRTEPRAEIQTGRLLEEFYCAVSPVTITVPPLRERLPELGRLIDTFLQRSSDLHPHGVKRMSPEAMNGLRSHAWPGNLSELQGVLRETSASAKGEVAELADLPFHVKHGALPLERRLPLDALLEKVEHRLIALALKLTQDNHTRAAEMLEIWRPRLLRRMEKFGFQGEKPTS